MNGKKHRTHHAAETVDGKIWVGCSCGWREQVEVVGLSWLKAMAAIYEARDLHLHEYMKAKAKA